MRSHSKAGCNYNYVIWSSVIPCNYIGVSSCNNVNNNLPPQKYQRQNEYNLSCWDGTLVACRDTGVMLSLVTLALALYVFLNC